MKSLATIFLLAAAALIAILSGARFRQSQIVYHVFKTTSVPQAIEAEQKQNSPQHLTPVLELEKNLFLSKGVTKWLYFLQRLESAQLEDYPAMASVVKHNPLMLKLLVTKWIERDPRHFFDSLVTAQLGGRPFAAEELTTFFFEEWTRKDPHAVIQALNETTNFGARLYWRTDVANALIRKDAELSLKMISQWDLHFNPYAPHLQEWAARNPLHAAQFALAHRSSATRSAMEAIGAEWGKTNPEAALDFAFKHPGNEGVRLAHATIKAWSERDLPSMVNWLSKADPSTRNLLSPHALEVWAKSDASSALSWCEANLTGPGLSASVGGILKGVADKNISTAAEMVASMPASQAKGHAAISVMEKWLWPDNSLTPPEMVKWLHTLDDGSLDFALQMNSARWTKIDMPSIVSFLDSAQSRRLPVEVFETVARSFAAKKPAEAIQWARKLPEKYRLRTEATVFESWSASQPIAAIQWLETIDETSRRNELFRTAIQTIVTGINPSDRLAALTQSQRASARHAIRDMNIPQERKDSFLRSLASPPSASNSLQGR